jgi:hypothetical protein
MKSVAFIFQITAIFLGVCNPDTVKVAGMRKINELSKGSYLVSSAGWSYHHKDLKYDRKDNVVLSFLFRASPSARETRLRSKCCSTPTSREIRLKLCSPRKAGSSTAPSKCPSNSPTTNCANSNPA